MHASASRELLDPRVALLKELADPVRLRVVDTLGNRGPSSVSELATALDLSLPQLSNHLRRLRNAGLVRVERVGRSAIYELADPGLEPLLPLLDSITGRVAPRARGQQAHHGRDFASARTCYDHLAGLLGVAIYAALVRKRALIGQPDGTVTLGPEAKATFARVGIDADAVRAATGRRRFAIECLDVTQHEPHLAGALGDAVARALLDRGWVKATDTREVRLTPRGRAGLHRTLGVSLAT